MTLKLHVEKSSLYPQKMQAYITDNSAISKEKKKKKNTSGWINTQIMQELSTNDAEKIQTCKGGIFFSHFKENRHSRCSVPISSCKK